MSDLVLSNLTIQGHPIGLFYNEPAPPVPVFDEVTIGTQTWMSKNLAIDDGNGGITIVDNVTANGVNFGTQYYYTQDAAIRVASTVAGWHLPSTSEFQTLVTYTGNLTVNLITTTGWNDNGNGNDMYGYNAYPVGQYTGNHNNAGTEVHFWSSISGQRMLLNPTYRTSPMISLESTSKGYSIRLIKDS